jgi:hypothetical protein
LLLEHGLLLDGFIYDPKMGMGDFVDALFRTHFLDALLASTNLRFSEVELEAGDQGRKDVVSLLYRPVLLTGCARLRLNNYNKLSLLVGSEQVFLFFI